MVFPDRAKAKEQIEIYGKENLRKTIAAIVHKTHSVCVSGEWALARWLSCVLRPLNIDIGERHWRLDGASEIDRFSGTFSFFILLHSVS